MNKNFKVKNWIDYHKMIDSEYLSDKISPRNIENTYVYKLQKENKNLKQINEEHRKLNGQLRKWDHNKDTRNSRQRIANAELVKRNKELKEDIKGYEQERQVLLDDLNEITEANKKLKEKNKKLQKQLDIKNNGFMASIEEICEYATILIEFENWLEAEILKMGLNDFYALGIHNCYDKLQELKGNNNENRLN